MSAWVFHRGALGDSVLLWPRLRSLRAVGSVTLVTDASKGRLAARELGISFDDAEKTRYGALWRADTPIEPVEGTTLVLDYTGPHASRRRANSSEVPPSPWHANLARMFPGARIESAPPPTGAEARALCERDPRAMPEPRDNPRGPIVMHVGAGSEAKRWPMSHWVELASLLRAENQRVELIAGEVESERLSRGDRDAFERTGGRFLSTLEELADTVREARAFVGSDSGPTHLAAQLGVRTIALFGTTDPAVWGPAGPCVLVMQESSGSMGSLTAEGVARAIGEVAG